jgi:hypothetical protein
VPDRGRSDRDAPSACLPCSPTEMETDGQTDTQTEGASGGRWAVGSHLVDLPPVLAALVDAPPRARHDLLELGAAHTAARRADTGTAPRRTRCAGGADAGRPTSERECVSGLPRRATSERVARAMDRLWRSGTRSGAGSAGRARGREGHGRGLVEGELSNLLQHGRRGAPRLVARRLSDLALDLRASELVPAESERRTERGAGAA